MTNREKANNNWQKNWRGEWFFYRHFFISSWFPCCFLMIHSRTLPRKGGGWVLLVAWEWVGRISWVHKTWEASWSSEIRLGCRKKSNVNSFNIETESYRMHEHSKTNFWFLVAMFEKTIRVPRRDGGKILTVSLFLMTKQLEVIKSNFSFIILCTSIDNFIQYIYVKVA